MKRYFFILLAVLTGHSALAQLTITITSVPSNTPPTDTLYLAGTFNTWDPGNASYRFTNNGGGNYSITIASGTGTMQYKITRGSWPKVESQANGVDIANRSYNYSSGNSLNIQVAGWKDLTTSLPPNVYIVSNTFSIPQLSTTRRIWIYLPPDYSTTTKQYPVLYMHDGQNLFDPSTAFGGNEWGVDESLTNLFKSGDRGCIVVGIDNGGNERINEYSPWVNSSYGGGKGDKYMDFIVSTLKPYIDGHYRTYPDRLHTGLMGSSMGGLISLYGSLKYQQVFAKAGILSPSLWFTPTDLQSFVQTTGRQDKMRIYLHAGTNEGSTTVSDVHDMLALLKSEGLDTSEAIEVIVPGGQHNEASWKQIFPSAYKWLFNETATTIEEPKSGEPEFIVMPNPATGNEITVRLSLPAAEQVMLSIVDMNGRVVDTLYETKLESGNHTLTFNRKLPAGFYFLSLRSGEQYYIYKMEVAK